MKTALSARLGAAALLAAALPWHGAGAVAPAREGAHATLVALINGYRAAPQACAGRRLPAAPPLAPEPALERVQVGPGTFLDLALERAGYPVERAEAISVSGPLDAQAAMDAIVPTYCATLMNAQLSAIAVVQRDSTWLIVLARPAPPSPLEQLPAVGDAGQRILEATNRARATPRLCGEQRYAAVPALSWNAALASAAQVHSQEMAALHYFSHRGKDGGAAAERATQAGYRWQRIGENIAVGQESAEDAVAGWLSSPGHCANIMNGGFTNMGAAYGLTSGASATGAAVAKRAYWTQVFGTPR